jgi:hypothetical protein
VDGPLATYMPTLYSHFEAQATSVGDIMDIGLRSLLQQRLTTQAAAELEQLEALLLDVNFSDTPDKCSSH